MRKTLWIALSFLILAGLVAGLNYLNYRSKRVEVRVEVAKVQEDIRGHLPVGTSRAAVASYLDQRGIQHSYVGELKDAPEYGHTEMAIIRETSRTWLVRGDIQILFKFDEQGRLIHYSVQEIFTGP